MLKKLGSLLILLVTLILAVAIINIDEIYKKYVYPVRYAEYVEKYSDENNIDKYFVYAIIRTESNFDEKAESGVGARGLMQLMNDAFDWVKYRMNDERNIGYSDMFTAEYNIEYGTYLISMLYNEYGDKRTALAAYHSGRGNVNKWLEDKDYSDDGKTLKKYPSPTTEHYVNKVMTAYNGYTNLYKNQEE